VFELGSIVEEETGEKLARIQPHRFRRFA
jgi:hypothetical protein